MTRTPNGWRDAGFPRPHPCPLCGRLTIFRLCDPCVSLELRLSRTSDQVDRGVLGGPNDGQQPDEFARTLAAWRSAPERVPVARYWSGCCLWCAREIREQSGADETHRPPLARIQTCYRHRKALLAFAQWLRNETHGKDGAA